MPRQPRVEYAGAMYHVMSRGDGGEAICDDDADRAEFIRTLGETCGRTGWVVHAYVLMGNHFHLLLETPEANLVTGMKWFLGTYTQRHNVQRSRHGHVFQGRYKAVMLDGAEAGVTVRVSTYIHLNPLRAGLEKRVGQYSWSSLPVYLRRAAGPEWLKRARVYGSVGIDGRGRSAGRQYGRYLDRAWGTRSGRQELEDGWKVLRRGWCVGSETFRERMLDEVGEKLRKSRAETYGGSAKRAHDERVALARMDAGLSALGLRSSELSRIRKGDKRKQVLAWWISRHTSARTEWISQQLNMGHRTSVSKAVKEVEGGMDAERNALRRLIEKTPGISD